jgi:hypothetical protein
MSISGKMYAWGHGAKNVPEEPGVYGLYDGGKVLIYIGGSPNLREKFTQYLKTNFSEDPRKRETQYYKRELAPKQRARIKELLNEYRKENGQFPKCNFPSESPSERVASESTFKFYKDVAEPLPEVAFNPQDLRKKIRRVPVASLEFHQKRGDFAKWIRNVFKDSQLAETIDKIDKTGEDLRRTLFHSFKRSNEATCPRCGIESTPAKTWKMAGRPSRTGERLQLTIAHYRCPICGKTFRKAIAKEKVRTS